MRSTTLHALFFLSGFAALVYEVLWLRELSLLFGSTAAATATTLAIFFGGIALGSEICGRRSVQVTAPLRAYAWLEIGVALCALGHFVLLDAYHALYAPLFQALLDRPSLLLLAKAILAAGMLLPAAVLLGGTFPMMAQELIRDRQHAGRRASLLYGVNTLGGACGAFAAGFFLPRWLGYSGTYRTAIAINVAVAMIALGLGRRSAQAQGSGGLGVVEVGGAPVESSRDRGIRAASSRATRPSSSDFPWAWMAFLSGFATLALEVLWTRMFAQVLHNSVYSFTAILVTFLMALALGSLLASRLVHWSWTTEAVLRGLALASGVSVVLSAFVFYGITGGLGYVGAKAAFWPYVAAVFGNALAVMLVPGVLIGSLFPYLLKSAGQQEGTVGRGIGRLVALNTAGGIAGSLMAGFALLPLLGLWGSIKAIGLAYLALAVALVDQRQAPAWWGRATPLAAMLLFATLLDPGRLPIVGRDAARGEALLDVREGRDAIVAVIRDDKDLRIKVDNFYALGGTSARTYEETQADVPLMIHLQPRSVFFLGMGTGITAAAALRHPVEQVVTCELLPDVIRAARLFFGKHAEGLFTDPRSRVVADDGRSYLRGTADRYDVVVGDLFVPWNPGTGGLYSREHFETVRKRLNPDGVFAQWLPLYQLSREEVWTIARTMQAVFPQVTVWRGDFLAERPILALVGQEQGARLDGDRLVENFRRRRKDDSLPRAMILGLMNLFYAGNLSAAQGLIPEGEVNTDDWPLIELQSPVTQRQHWGAGQAWFTGAPLAEWFEEIQRRVPPESDPYLAPLSTAERGFVRAGLSLFQAAVFRKLGDPERAARHAAEFRDLVPREVARMFEAEPREP